MQGSFGGGWGVGTDIVHRKEVSKVRILVLRFTAWVAPMMSIPTAHFLKINFEIRKKITINSTVQAVFMNR